MQVLHAVLSGDFFSEAHALYTKTNTRTRTRIHTYTRTIYIYIYIYCGVAACGAVGQVFVRGTRAAAREAGLIYFYFYFYFYFFQVLHAVLSGDFLWEADALERAKQAFVQTHEQAATLLFFIFVHFSFVFLVS